MLISRGVEVSNVKLFCVRHHEVWMRFKLSFRGAYDLNSSLPQYLWVGATESRDQSLSGMLMSALAGKL